MKSSNICFTKEGCIIEISRKRILIEMASVLFIMGSFFSWAVWYYLNGEVNKVYSVGGMLLSISVLMSCVIRGMRLLRHPPNPIVIDRKGISFPNGQSTSWHNVKYMYFKKGHYVPMKLCAETRNLDYIFFDNIEAYYTSRQDIISLIERYAQRNVFISKSVYYLGYPSENDYKKFKKRCYYIKNKKF